MTTLVKTNRNFYPTFNTLFEDFFGDQISPLHGGQANVTTPSVNVAESDEGFTIEVAAPGFEKNDFKVAVDNNVLSISIESKEEQEEATKQYARREFNYASFERRFTLPKGQINESNIQAQYENGILNIVLPKAEEAKPKPTMQIEIK